MKYMLLCEVALGNIQNIQYKDGKLSALSSGYHSIKTPKAVWTPEPAECVFWNGMFCE